MRSTLLAPRAALASLLVPLLLGGCLGGGDAVDTASAEPPRDALVVGGPAGSEYSFEPAALATSVGRAIRVRFVNEGAEPHTFTVMALRADTGAVAPGDEATLTLKPTKAGTFEIACTLPGHVELGMTGTLRVT